MKYKKIIKGQFVSRPNRFIARVLINGVEETVHVKNTGRCKELLVDKATVYLYESDNPARKTKYDLIAVEKNTPNGTLLVNMDSQVPNDVAEEWLKECYLFSKNAVIKREFTYNKSRFDFYIEDGSRKAFLEVKGVTLENDGVCAFPDAPTDRGAKHLRGLSRAAAEGCGAYVLFVIQMGDVKYLHPNDATDPAFGIALREAAGAGVKILAVDCCVTTNTMTIGKSVPVLL